MHQYILLFLMAVFINPVWADDSYWQCRAHDTQGNQWVVNNLYEQVATNKAFEACKKQSDAPTSCKALKDNCDYFSNGLSTRPMWRCMALDLMSKIWKNDPRANRDEAALEAEAICKQHSPMPETCYINLMTCKNLNERVYTPRT